MTMNQAVDVLQHRSQCETERDLCFSLLWFDLFSLLALGQELDESGFSSRDLVRAHPLISYAGGPVSASGQTD